MKILEKVKSRKPPKILSKKENYALYNSGFLGNKPKCWDSIEDIENSDWNGKISVRTKIEGKKLTAYELTFHEAKQKVEEWKSSGISEEKITFNQSMPDHKLRVQGEIMRSFRHLELRYSTLGKPMKKALEDEEKYAKGLKANQLLRANLFARSYDDIIELLNLFPDSIIEFSSYDIQVGNRPNRNTVIWEVRNY